MQCVRNCFALLMWNSDLLVTGLIWQDVSIIQYIYTNIISLICSLILPVPISLSNYLNICLLFVNVHIFAFESGIWHSYKLWLVDLPFSLIGKMTDLHARGTGFKPKQGQYLSLLHWCPHWELAIPLRMWEINFSTSLHRCWHPGRVEDDPTLEGNNAVESQIWVNPW